MWQTASVIYAVGGAVRASQVSAGLNAPSKIFHNYDGNVVVVILQYIVSTRRCCFLAARGLKDQHCSLLLAVSCDSQSDVEFAAIWASPIKKKLSHFIKVLATMTEDAPRNHFKSSDLNIFIIIIF